MGYIFLPSDRLRHCRGAAVTPPQSVTATVFPAVTQQEGSTAVFFCCFLPNPLPTQLLHLWPFLQVVVDSRLQPIF